MSGSSDILIIGVGNPFRGDDGLGWRAVDCLRKMSPWAIPIRESSGEGTEILEAFQTARCVYILDASSSGAAPGKIRRIDALRERLPAGSSRASTHAFGVAEAVALARSLRQLPEKLVVFAIEGASFDPGTGLSPGMEAAAQEAARRLLLEIEQQMRKE